MIDELALSRKSFEEIILAKNKELEVTKVCSTLISNFLFGCLFFVFFKIHFKYQVSLYVQEEKEKARAQKEEVVTQVTEVLENELQCIICSELFIEVGFIICLGPIFVVFLINH